jgi:hypothetical protein
MILTIAGTLLSAMLLASDVTPGPGHTFYSAAGNWLGWSCLALIIWILAKALRYSA